MGPRWNAALPCENVAVPAQSSFGTATLHVAGWCARGPPSYCRIEIEFRGRTRRRFMVAMNDSSTPPQVHRRQFLQSSGSLAALLALGQPPAAIGENPSKRLRVGVMGLGRGRDHVQAFLAVPDVEVAYVCDVDE